MSIFHNDTTAIVSENADNNQWHQIRTYWAGGAATYSIEWYGGATSGESTRDEIIWSLNTNLPARAYGTGTFTVGAQDIHIVSLDKTNSSPVPIEDAGASIIDDNWRDYTPTVTAFTGTFTSVSAIGRYQRNKTYYNVQVQINATTIGTAAVAAIATLPIASKNTGTRSSLMGFNGSTGTPVGGFIALGGSTVIIKTLAGAFPIANGQGLDVSGYVRTA